MITLKDKKEIEHMKEGGEKLAQILEELARMVIPGVSAAELERSARNKIRKQELRPAFLNYHSGFMNVYPAVLCVSVNDEVVHGLPSEEKVFQNGDLVSIDCGLWYKGLCVDSAITVSCGTVSKKAQKLLNVTKEALNRGISKCTVGNYIGDIGSAIQIYVEKEGFLIIKSLVGHGVGHNVHEEPPVPNFFPFNPNNKDNKGPALKSGMTLAIEPMVSISDEFTKTGKDGFASITQFGSLSAHFEHTVAVTNNKPIVLTSS